jgi:alpha-mannosidase
MGITLIKSGIEPNPVTDQEEHVFTYALYPHAEGWQQAGTVQEAYRLNQPALAMAGGEAGASWSLCSVNKANVIVETIKQAEDGDGWIVRMYECDNAKTPVRLQWNRPVASVEECNCIEERVGDAVCENGEIRFAIKPYEIKCFRIREK